MLLLISAIFYVIGSVPTAVIYMRLRHGSNILNQGSGNSGAMNVYDVTGSKADGFVVLLIDLLKGFIPMYFLMKYWTGNHYELIVPAVCIVMGHNFPFWTGFRGGRGLASGAGIILAVKPVLVPVWLVSYFVSRKLIDNVHVASSIALIILPAVVYFGRFDMPVSNRFLLSMTASVCFAAMLKHAVPVYKYLKQKNSKDK